MTKFRKLNRPTGHGMSMLRTMVSQLVKHERIETTVSKAKEIRCLADNMVQLGKEGSLCAARRAAAFLRGDDIEKVDIQDYFELVYELVMQLQWPILSLLAEKMSLGSQNRQPHNHHQELP
ncbi:50S ribosomal protein L17-like isoform X1 [Mangifera indica]|uniref:50S ribosomal protein L17-like isoform X1 n=1 Tax=Mangifera indica TaxID=29780 RepID=UPI001CF9E75B|nr:50S ribosomal protein L17-like isoform X1 [Mangifera indica]